MADTIDADTLMGYTPTVSKMPASVDADTLMGYTAQSPAKAGTPAVSTPAPMQRSSVATTRSLAKPLDLMGPLTAFTGNLPLGVMEPIEQTTNLMMKALP